MVECQLPKLKVAGSNPVSRSLYTAICKVTNSKSINIIRSLALIATLVGAIGSLGLTLYTGRRNDSVFLILLFAIWVLSPFVALTTAGMLSKRWSVIRRLILYSLMIFISLGSLASYSGILSPPGAKPAGVFLIVPLISLLLMAIVLLIAALLSRRSSIHS